MPRSHRHRSTPWNAAAVARKTTWARFNETLTNAAAATYSAVDLLANFKVDGGQTQGVTITRIHLQLTVTTPTITAGDTFAWGVMVGQNTDVGVSVAGSPQPIADPYEDWMWWEVPYADGALNYEPGAANVIRRDIRAQRRMPELQQTLLLIIGPQTRAISFGISGSVLLKLP